MQNLKRRIEQLEGLGTAGLGTLTEAELDARIAAFGLKVDKAEELETCIAELKADLSNYLEQEHAKP